ncbi:general substrate transporter [Zychaea mexicana]|uniref:general substrate transporter n=1 Tax=Zychaea mexicana TaxID=64656 RepID=UPI0022FF3B7E|nr:general substrate transporter [Zychaea mexicana]KAI9498487.1 general substrate transporter [Zychaea mexicana]
MDSRQAGVRLSVIFCAAVASLGTFNCGINTSALNIPGYFVRNCPDASALGDTTTYFPGTVLPKCIPMDDLIWGIATGVFAIGGLLGAMFAGCLAERMGRRDSMFLVNITFVIGAAMNSLATTSTMFAIGRVFVGIGSGAMSVLVSMYIAEIAPPKQRGMLVGLLQLFATLGVLVVELCGLGLQSAIGWRLSAAITVIPAFLQVMLLPLCVRSPRWLISQNRIDEAREALLKLRRGDIETEFADMTRYAAEAITSITAPAVGLTKSATPKESEALSLLQVMRIPILAILTGKMMIIHAGFQLCGISAIMYYSTSIFQATFGATGAAYLTVGVASIFVLFTVIGLALVDRLGRKSLILFSALAMCISSILMTVGLLLHISILQVICVMLFVATFGVGLGICPFLFTSESFPTYAVGAACSAALVSNWFFNFVIGFLFPTLLRVCGNYVFMLFAAVTFLLALFIHFFTTETARKSIDNIGRELGWYDLDPKRFLCSSSSSSSKL